MLSSTLYAKLQFSDLLKEIDSLINVQVTLLIFNKYLSDLVNTIRGNMDGLKQDKWLMFPQMKPLNSFN